MTDKIRMDGTRPVQSGRVSLPFLDLETDPLTQAFALVTIYFIDYDIQY